MSSRNNHDFTAVPLGNVTSSPSFSLPQAMPNVMTMMMESTETANIIKQYSISDAHLRRLLFEFTKFVAIADGFHRKFSVDERDQARRYIDAKDKTNAEERNRFSGAFPLGGRVRETGIGTTGTGTMISRSTTTPRTTGPQTDEEKIAANEAATALWMENHPELAAKYASDENDTDGDDDDNGISYD